MCRQDCVNFIYYSLGFSVTLLCHSSSLWRCSHPLWGAQVADANLSPACIISSSNSPFPCLYNTNYTIYYFFLSQIRSLLVWEMSCYLLTVFLLKRPNCFPLSLQDPLDEGYAEGISDEHYRLEGKLSHYIPWATDLLLYVAPDLSSALFYYLFVCTMLA